MIDPVLLRNDPDVVKRSQRARGNDESVVDEALAAESARRSALGEFEQLRASQKVMGERVKAASKEEKPALIAEAQEFAAAVKAADARAKEAEAEFDRIASRIENIVIDGVPAGGEDNFVTLRTVGEVPEFDFEPRDHLELGELLGAIDMERGAKVSGARFYFLRGVGARLEIALMNMALDLAMRNDFTPLITPTLVKPEIMGGTGFLGEHADEVYHLKDQDLYLTGTSEVALAGYHSDEILNLRAGPGSLRGLVDLLPKRGGIARQGYARDPPRAPVQQARDVRLHGPGKRRGGARSPRFLAGRDAAGPWPELPRHRRCSWRSGFKRCTQVRYRSVGADAGHVPRAHLDF